MEAFQVLQYITTKSCLGAKEEDGDDEDMDGNQENGDKSKRPEMESETPWVSLASLALFKLFNDWQAQVCFTFVLVIAFMSQTMEPNWLFPGLPAAPGDFPRPNRLRQHYGESKRSGDLGKVSSSRRQGGSKCKSTTTSCRCAQAEKTSSTQRGEVPARKSSGTLNYSRVCTEQHLISYPVLCRRSTRYSCWTRCQVP